MKPEERETSTERIVRLSLWAALAALYMTLIVVTFIKLSVVPQASGAEPIDPAWLGFWGNVFGGVLGLAGGLVAAYAAVRAVERQLNHAERRREQDEVALVKEMFRILRLQAETTIRDGYSLLEAADRGEPRATFNYASSIILAWIPESDHYTRYLVQKIPTAGLRLELLVSVQKKWGKTAMLAERHNRQAFETGADMTIIPDAEHCCLATGAYIGWFMGFIDALREVNDRNNGADLALVQRLHALTEALKAQAKKLKEQEAELGTGRK